MNKILTPNAFFGSIDEISPDFFTSRNIKAVFLDIDNTLVTPHTPVPDERAKSFITSLTDAGITVCLVSNNKKERVDTFNTLSLISVHRAAKPLTHSYKKLLKKLNLKSTEAAAVGDQFFSDISGANLSGLFTVYVSPIKIGGEGAFVWLKRKLEKPLLKKFSIKNV